LRIVDLTQADPDDTSRIIEEPSNPWMYHVVFFVGSKRKTSVILSKDDFETTFDPTLKVVSGGIRMFYSMWDEWGTDHFEFLLEVGENGQPRGVLLTKRGLLGGKTHCVFQ
jgi:hypothetical protein